MSDFDDVLERLVVDPAFAGALAADPAAALAGYTLTDDEIALLHTQVGAEPPAQHAVETRANQSSTFGLLGSIGGLLGAGGAGGGGIGIGDQIGRAGIELGQGSGSGGIGGAMPHQSGLGSAATSGLGSAYEQAASFGPYAQAEGAHGGAGALSGFADEIGRGLTETGPRGEAGFGEAPPAVPASPPEGYQTRVDVDGDGRWDEHILVGRRDGGVDIVVDRDGDGRADFIGHDLDADGRVDSADYDKNSDGFFEKTMYDDDGDGWLDRTTHHQP